MTIRATSNGEENAAFRVDHLSVGFPKHSGEAEEVVHDVSFSVRAGETLGVVGESGSGKSLSLLAATGLLGDAPVVGGRALLGDTDLLALPERELRRLLGRDIGFIFQDPDSNLHPYKSIGAQIDEVLRVHTQLDRHARRARVVELLERVHIPRAERRLSDRPSELSGGQRQRVMIAMAIALEPRLIIADEPTTALDVSVQAEVLDLLRDVQQRSGSAIVFVSHDLAVISRIADRVTVLRNGRTVESGPVRRLLTRPETAYTRHLIEAARLHTVDLPGLQTRERSEPAREPLLRVRALDKSYRRRTGQWRSVLEGIDLDVARGEIVGLVGESGSGKSTIGRIVAGLSFADSGDIELGGTRLPVRRSHDLPQLGAETRSRVQQVFQDPYSSLNPRRTVRQTIATALVASGEPASSIHERVDEVAEACRLDAPLVERRPAQLSGGQRQRVAIARALAPRPDLIVADEAISSLDVTTQQEIVELFQRLRDDYGTAFLFISHDLGIVAQIADRVVVLGTSGVEDAGPTAEVFLRPRSAYTRRLIESVPALAGTGAQE